jgi:gas vesicle protein
MKTMITLYADEGKVLTNGTDYGTTVSLAVGENAENWHEITQEEYEKLTEEVQNGEDY